MSQRIIGIVGWKNNGKTTLVERLIAEFGRRGLRVSTVKHAHHQAEIDAPGKDSWRHREAGASEVVVASSRRWALIHENRDDAEPSLSTILARLDPVDLVIVEGFKAFPHAKIEVHRQARGTPLLALTDPSIVALASDTAIPLDNRPVFALDDIVGIADFIWTHVEADIWTHVEAEAAHG